MPIDPSSGQSWLVVPPLDLPLVLRTENGRFGALRPTPLRGMPPCATTQVIPADDPSNPTGTDVPYANQLHEAVDLAAAAGDCVYAGYSGRVVEVEVDRDLTRGSVTIDHHPAGLGFLTKYLHITEIAVDVGDFIQKGIPFAAVSSRPTQPHLHFELWAVVDRDSAGEAGWPGDTDLVPVDPTRMLYAWEERTAADQELPGGPAAPASVGSLRLHTVPFFYADLAGDHPLRVHVPMYEPMTAAERLAIELLRDAHRANIDVALRYRASAFWGIDVVTEVGLA